MSPEEMRKQTEKSKKDVVSRAIDHHPEKPIEIAFSDEVDLAALKKNLTIKPSQ